ncbi:MAG: hypothetical protein NC823_01285, partial [Candidatus Omnitrophica bacterium]|nr:hypothetical protein [Candidatus Omnitrophota bacterium]
EDSDQIFKAITSGGFEPYFRLGDSWNSGPNFPAPERRAPINRHNWVRAAVEVVRHYRSLTGAKLRYVEIWNEPDHKQFWDDSPYEFHLLFHETACALKKNFPEIKVGGPGFTAAAVVLPRGNLTVTAFLDFIQRQRTPLDFISWHLYANDPVTFRQAARFYRQELDKRGLFKTESHVTEYHTNDRRLPAGLSPIEVRAGSAGAAILTAAWIALQAENVSQAFVYRGIDMSMHQPNFYGLFQPDGTPKKPALAFSLWSRLAGCEKLLVKTGEQSGGLWFLAGRNSAGQILVLVANPTQEGHWWRVSFQNHPEKKRVTIEEINQSAREVIKREINLDRIFLPAYSTMLATFN